MQSFTVIMSTHHQCLVSWALLTQYADEKTEAPESISHSPGCRSEAGSEASLPASHMAHGAQGPGGNERGSQTPTLSPAWSGKVGSLSQGWEPRPRSRSKVRPLKPSVLSSTLGWGGDGGLRKGEFRQASASPSAGPPHFLEPPPMCFNSSVGPSPPAAESWPGLLGPGSSPGPAPSTCLAQILSISR